VTAIYNIISNCSITMLKISRYMSDHHNLLNRLFDNYSLSGKGKENKTLQTFNDFSKQLLRHIECEEEIIFPLIDTKLNPVSVPTYMLKKQHIRIKKYLEEIHFELTKHINNSEELEQDLKKLLDCHNATEEYTIYSWIDNLLNDKEKQKVLMTKL